MNINSTRPQATVAKPQAKKTEAAGESNNSSVTITLPDSVSIGGAVKHAARILPGTASLVLHAPRVIASPILNTISPASSSSDQLVRERWSDVLGGSMLGTAVGAAVGAAGGSVAEGVAAGAFLGAVAGGVKAFGGMLVNDFIMEKNPTPSLPGVGDAASQAYRENDGSHAAGVALRKGYGAGISEAYMKGARVADGSVNFMRGLVGLEAK